MIDHGRIHEHAAVGQHPVKIGGQRAEVAEGVLALVLRYPILNALGERQVVGGVEGQLPGVGFAGEYHPPRLDERHCFVDVEPPRARVFQPQGKRAGGDNEHPGGDIIPAGAEAPVLRPFEVPLGDAEEEADRQPVRDVRRAVQRIEIDEVSAFGIQVDDFRRLLADGLDYPARGFQIVDGDFVGDLVHPHHVFTLDVDIPGRAEQSLQRAGQIIILNALGRADDGVHQDQEVIRSIVPFLVLQQEIIECLLEAAHGLSS